MLGAQRFPPPHFNSLTARVPPAARKDLFRGEVKWLSTSHESWSRVSGFHKVITLERSIIFQELVDSV